MDNQWHHHHHHHHHQAVQGNICPTCSISHFPFCPPHPASFNQNPRYPSPQDHPFHGPGFDPYRLSTGPYHHRPNDDGYRDPISWHKNPNLDRDSRGYGVYSGSHVDGFTPLPMPHDYTGNGFPSGGDRNIKRMRVDDLDSNSGGFVNEYHVNSSRVMSELDERRLKLIRDHGGASSDPSQSGASSFTDFNQEIDSVSERRFTGTSFGEHGIFNYLQGSRVETSFKSPTNMVMHDFQDPGFGSCGKKIPFLHSENVPSSHSYREENRFDIPIEQGHQHHEAMVRHSSAEMADRYYSTPLKGDCDWKPHISQQGPCPFPEALSERNDFLSSAPYNEQRSRISTENWASNDQPLGPYKLRHPMHREYDFHSPSILNDTRQLSEVKLPSREGNQFPFNINNQGSYLSIHSGSSMISENPSQMHGSRMICAPPPLPPSPPPPLPVDSPGNTSLELKAAYNPHLSQPYFPNKPHLPVSTGFVPEESHAIRQPLSQQYSGEGQLFPLKHLSADKRKTIDASDLVKQPHRATRPDHIVIILRGLPGSGKSYLAKMFRDLEVENGGDAPRIHSMDDYFMTEVEKVDESEMAKSTSSGRGKKPTTKKVMEYCYEPEMEEAYRSSMLKAFRKTLEEGVFTFIIVDDRNLRVADFAQFWAIAKRSGYEVYLLEATYKDPVGCAARNVHGFAQDEIQKMARQWEEAPSWYLQLDVKSLFHGDDLKDGGIQEVDMDTEDRDLDEGLTGSQVEKHENTVVSTGDHATTGSSKDEERWDGDGAEGDHPTEQVKELGRSKWSDAFDEDDDDRTQIAKGNLNSLSGLIQAYAKDGKSVQWGDQAGNTGFAIGAAKKAKVLSLVIGPGAGYNLKSNPLPEVNPTSTPHTGERHGIFQEQLRAERESSKAIFDRRRHKIGLNVEED